MNDKFVIARLRSLAWHGTVVVPRLLFDRNAWKKAARQLILTQGYCPKPWALRCNAARRARKRWRREARA